MQHWEGESGSFIFRDNELTRPLAALSQRYWENRNNHSLESA